MLLNKSRIFIFILLFSSLSISSPDTISTNSNDISNDLKVDLFQIPLYEQYKFTNNYYLNQPITNVFRWTTVGTLTGATIGGLIDMQEKDYIFIPSTVIVGGIGMGAGFLFGTVLGTVNGFTHTRKKNYNPEYHDHRCRLGYDVQLFALSPILNRVIARYQKPPGIAIVFRPLNRKSFIPDNILIGYYQDWWGRHTDYSVTHFGRLRLKRIESCVRYDLINLKLLIPYCSVGLGYSWGLETEEIQEPYYDPIHNWPDSKLIKLNEYNIKSPIVRGYIGSEFNLFDFCYADFKIGYEIIGPYLFLRHKEYFPYVHNFLINFSIGTYIF